MKRAGELDILASKIVGKTVDFDEASRSLTSVISREVVDSDGEVIIVDGLDFSRFQKNPVVLWMHDPRDVIGTAEWWKPRSKGGVKELIAKTRFAETALAEEIFTLAIGGFLKGTSIGMHWPSIVRRDVNPTDLKDCPHWAGARQVVMQAQLMEYSHVSIPANPDSLTMAHSKGLITPRTFGYFAEYLQPKEPVVKVLSRPVVKEVPEPVVTVKEVTPTIKVVREPLKRKHIPQIIAMSEGRL